jgi:thiol-disulfide isomerase/thioredoxin
MIRAQQVSIETPDVKVISVSGGEVSLSDFKDKITLYDFWATWCPPCRESIPHLVSLHQDYKDKINIVGISLDSEDTAGQIPGFIKKYNMEYHQLLGDLKLTEKFGGVNAIPTMFIADNTGKIVYKHVGFSTKEDLLKILKKLFPEDFKG